MTAAALLFCIAIGAFATSNVILIKEVGIGIALAVAIDATIVRAVLVPSLMADPRPLELVARHADRDRRARGARAKLTHPGGPST